MKDIPVYRLQTHYETEIKIFSSQMENNLGLLGLTLHLWAATKLNITVVSENKKSSESVIILLVHKLTSL